MFAAFRDFSYFGPPSSLRAHTWVIDCGFNEFHALLRFLHEEVAGSSNGFFGLFVLMDAKPSYMI